jgi:hypothetical protein
MEKNCRFKEQVVITQPVIQVNSASTWLQNTLKASTGKTFTVKPVILFPGWFVESTE